MDGTGLWIEHTVVDFSTMIFDSTSNKYKLHILYLGSNEDKNLFKAF